MPKKKKGKSDEPLSAEDMSKLLQERDALREELTKKEQTFILLTESLETAKLKVMENTIQHRIAELTWKAEKDYLTAVNAEYLKSQAEDEAHKNRAIQEERMEKMDAMFWDTFFHEPGLVEEDESSEDEGISDKEPSGKMDKVFWNSFFADDSDDDVVVSKQSYTSLADLEKLKVEAMVKEEVDELNEKLLLTNYRNDSVIEKLENEWMHGNEDDTAFSSTTAIDDVKGQDSKRGKCTCSCYNFLQKFVVSQI